MNAPINPADCPPDRVYMGTYRTKRLAMQRLDNDSEPWRLITEYLGKRWASDADVSGLVPLVEAGPITRDELPDASVATDMADAEAAIALAMAEDHAARCVVLTRLWSRNATRPAPSVTSGRPVPRRPSGNWTRYGKSSGRETTSSPATT